MDTKSLVKALKIAVREVIKEELTEILKEGLQSTINEMQTKTTIGKSNNIPRGPKIETSITKSKQAKFNDNKWASILNQTEALQDKTMPIESYAEMMNESYDTLSFNSADALGFGVNRQNIKSNTTTPAVMEDPETGKVYEVAPEVQQVLNRDYSALMRAINAKKGK
jgi:hypothetical protein